MWLHEQWLLWKEEQIARKIGLVGLIALALVLVIVWIAHHYWAFVDAPGTQDLTPRQRTAAFKSALRHGGIPALREQGGMDVLTRDDIAHVGNSSCIGEHECANWVRPRRSVFSRCESVQANL